MNVQRLPLLVLAASLTFTLNGCATQSKSDEMEAQIMQHDAQMRQMQPVQADMYNQVQSLREELNDIKGQLVDIRNGGGAAAMVDKLNRHEQALHQIETSMAMNFNLGSPLAGGNAGSAGAAGVAGASGAIGAAGAAQAAAPATAPQAPAALSQGTAQAAEAAPAAQAQPAGAAPSGDTWGQETPQPKAPKAEKDMSVALYEAGVNSFNSRQYGDAQRSFSDFIKNFGSNPKAPNAQYYLAECYFQKNQFNDAALAYDTVITKYGNSDKAPAAYLKQGICFSKMQQDKAAKARLAELIKKYPNSPEATRAKTFLKTNK